MNQKTTALRNTFTVLFFLFFVFAMLGGLFWANLLYVRQADISLDFLPFWKGANNLLVEGLPPYGEFTTYEIQQMVYGRTAGPGELPLRVDMPLPLLLLFLPVGAFAEMAIARAAWMLVLEISLVLLIVFMFRLSDWRLNWFWLLLLFLFGFLWPASLDSLLSASFSLVLVMLLFGAILASRDGLDELAGMLLALSFFDLESGGLLLLFLLLWFALNGRWRIWAGLLMALTLLGVTAFIIQAEWWRSFLLAVASNWRANPDPSTFSLFTGWFPGLGEQISWGLVFVILLLLMVEGQQSLGRSKLHFFWVASLVAAVIPLVGLPVASSGPVFLLPAFLLSASVLAQRWAVLGRWMAILVLALSLGLAWLFATLAPESSFLWMSLLAVLLLYWVRWWVARPVRLWADRISAGGSSRVPY